MGAKLLKSECVGASYDAFSDITGKYYRKFYNKMVALFTRPGLISLDEANLAPFKSFNGDVYMGEAEAVGENAATFAAKEAVSKAKAKKLTRSKDILVHILGSADKVDTSTANETVSALREIAPDAEIISGAHIDEKLGDALRVVVAYDLSMEEYNPRRFTLRPDMEDMPELIMEEILTGKRPTQT